MSLRDGNSLSVWYDSSVGAHHAVNVLSAYEAVKETSLVRQVVCSLRLCTILLRQPARKHKQGWP